MPVTLLRLQAHNRFAASALLPWLGTDEESYVGLDGRHQGLEMLPLALEAGLLPQVEIPASKDVQPLLRLPISNSSGHIR